VLVVVVMRVERKESIGGGRDREGREDSGKGGNEFLKAVSKCRVRAFHPNRMAG